MEEDSLMEDQLDIENMDLEITDPAERAAFYNFMAEANKDDSNNTAVASREIGSASRVASRQIGANARAASHDIVQLENNRAARANKRTAAVLKVASSAKPKRRNTAPSRPKALPFQHPMRSLTSNTDTPQAPKHPIQSMSDDESQLLDTDEDTARATDDSQPLDIDVCDVCDAAPRDSLWHLWRTNLSNS